MAIIELRGDGGQDKGGAWGQGEKRSDTQSTLEVDPSGLHVEDKGKCIYCYLLLRNKLLSNLMP